MITSTANAQVKALSKLIKNARAKTAAATVCGGRDPDVPGDTERADRESVRFRIFCKRSGT